jgi:hypothetical protein
VNTAGSAVAPQNGQPPHSPANSPPEPEPEPEIDDGDSVLSDPPPHDEPMPISMQIDGMTDHVEHATEEPNPKKRKRYNDPPNEVHAELRRPQLPGQWYSKTTEQWEELSHLHKLIYSHVGRIEETDLGEEVDPCEACRKRGFKCMKYKQDHPEVEKLYKGNVRVGTSCTRCRRYRRTCAPPGSKKLNGTVTTPSRPQPMTNGYSAGPGTTHNAYQTQGMPERDALDTWENTLLAAASGGSPLTSVASTPAEYADPIPGSLPPPAHLQTLPTHPPPHTDHNNANFEHDDVNNAVAKLTFLSRVQALESELRELRATQSEFNKERRDWNDQKRDLQAEIYHLRDDQRKTREENWALQTKVLQLEKDALAGKGADMERIMAEAELKVENRQLNARVDVLNAQRQEMKEKVKELKKGKKQLKRRVAELELESGAVAGGDEESGLPPQHATSRNSDLP